MKKEKKIPDQTQRQPGKETKMKPQPEIIRKGYKGSEKLKNKVALITGGDSGIGRSVAVHFAREGANIAIVYLEEDKDAKKTSEMVKAEGSDCIIIAGDLRDAVFCEKVVEQCISKFGKLNVVVNNAAMQFAQDSLLQINDPQLHQTFETNIYSYFRITRAALKYLNEGDCIINTSSVTAYRGSDHLIDYASTKGAIVSFTRSLSKNLAAKKIRVNGVAPGPIWTPLIPATLDNVSDFGRDTPLGRPGQPSEVAPAYVYLACEDSSYVTGQFIHVNGGEIIGG
ncbi:SDR family oxidoreductase [Aequorivita marisscotiae]|uniref:SDR family oxidoreductase n=1 Tax=Aequorivita marisscotiae TaxID=3040348 RepID=A0ABY8KTY0_9FLAO|nr:SDR family oxidoreductase [Aequorivita sp. Ant34-E75]WGF92019.1 SDR family oxidoreductase [Aequorivita sp. Ant34-E75]